MSSKICNSICAIPRALVSQNKRRFTKDRYDLDLCYLHPRIIVMGFPAIGMEKLYRNPRDQVIDFLEERHENHYMVFNFCSEASRCYPAQVFDGRVKRYPIEDHNVPTFTQILSFCETAANWLHQNEHNVVALHCKAGKGRAGMMACMLLLRMQYAASAEDAIQRYNQVRVVDLRGLTVTSQRKWVKYYDLYRQSYTATTQLNSSHNNSLVSPVYSLHDLRICNGLSGVSPPHLDLKIYQLNETTLSKVLIYGNEGYNHYVMDNENPLMIQGAILIQFNRLRWGPLCKPKRYFKIWLHTYFLSSQEIRLPTSESTPSHSTTLSTQDQSDLIYQTYVFHRDEMDWVSRDRKFQIFPAAFELELRMSRIR